ncbi:GNAT family N-acetyltransferase [Bdellovibrio svalbardensis]|uniref:GNAT family N-acetyltransferase n=1 Tax=Bdellovibrio svalbardensis TaxID=2972972 RepID=A0ABT6DL10_9BACT|nr:GNAT family N-acetyltransferase [Bdellovibrio svalbardensis]MDG0817202.1 GNAT family N-acetyltransferase [Bdellovibrio svalbardensis]
MTSTTLAAIPTIKTTRLKLRPFSLADAPEVQRMAGSIKVAQMTATIPHPYPDGAAESWISTHLGQFTDGDAVTWALEELSSGNLIGCISYGVSKTHKRAEMGYWIGEEYWGKGYCTEAAISGIDFCFQHFSLNKITSRHLAHNPASGKVMLKAGMQQEGYLRQDMIRYGQVSDMVIFGLLRSDWERS